MQVCTSPKDGFGACPHGASPLLWRATGVAQRPALMGGIQDVAFLYIQVLVNLSLTEGHMSPTLVP